MNYYLVLGVCLFFGMIASHLVNQRMNIAHDKKIIVAIGLMGGVLGCVQGLVLANLVIMALALGAYLETLAVYSITIGLSVLLSSIIQWRYGDKF
jgi:hypothetical protein